MCESATGWHMGISSAVRFAAIIPAVRATSSGSPLGFFASARNTAGDIRTKALASASRAVRALGTRPPSGRDPERHNAKERRVSFLAIAIRLSVHASCTGLKNL